MQTIPWHRTGPSPVGKTNAMTFRRKLLVVFALTVFLSVAAVALLVSEVTDVYKRQVSIHGERDDEIAGVFGGVQVATADVATETSGQ